MNEEIIQEGLRRTREKLGDKQLLFFSVAGSHLWGLDRPNSDYDFRGVYLEPTSNFWKLGKPKDSVELDKDGVFDGQFYEVEKLFNMVAKNNGNAIQMLLSPAVYVHPFFDAVGIGEGHLTKKLAHYFRGYANSQRKRAMSQRGTKSLLYTYREMFSGLYTMRYGKVIFDFKVLKAVAFKEGWYTGGLLDQFFGKEKRTITKEEWDVFFDEWELLSEKLDVEADNSKLPSECEDSHKNLSTLLYTYRNKQIMGLM